MKPTEKQVFWVISIQVAILNFYLGGFGPGQSLLRAQQHTSLTVAGLHGTALGIASIFAGMSGPHLVHRFGRATTSWLGMAIFSIGVLFFIFSPPVQLTLLATLIAGFGTSIVINSMVTQLSHHYPRDSTKMVSQSSGIASGGYVLGILSAGAIAGTSFNWRLGLLVVVPASLILFLIAKNVLGSEHVPEKEGRQKGALNHKFWFSWVGFIACISSEFATTFWASALLQERVGGSAAIATVCIISVGTGMGLGRWFGPHVLNGLNLDGQLKAIMMAQFIGFASFWFSHLLWISLLSLLVVGCGLSMQFALASVRLIAFSEGRPDLAIGKSSLAAGIAIAGAPFILGVLGDNLGISRAYLMVPVLILVALATIYAIPSEQPTLQESI